MPSDQHTMTWHLCCAVFVLAVPPRRLQQIRSSWQEHPNNNNAVMRLTAECRDLLDKMFDTNQVCGWCAVAVGSSVHVVTRRLCVQECVHCRPTNRADSLEPLCQQSCLPA